MTHDPSFMKTGKTDLYGKMPVFTTKAGGGGGDGHNWKAAVLAMLCLLIRVLATGARSLCGGFTQLRSYDLSTFCT